jgi:hypothetical protein
VFFGDRMSKMKHTEHYGFYKYYDDSVKFEDVGADGAFNNLSILNTVAA